MTQHKKTARACNEKKWIGVVNDKNVRNAYKVPKKIERLAYGLFYTVIDSDTTWDS